MEGTANRRWHPSRRIGVFAALVLALAILAAGIVHAASSPPQQDVSQTFSFKVEIEGVDAGLFKSVSGLSIETEVVEFREGGSNLVLKLPGRTKWPNLVLKRGFHGSDALFSWAQMNAVGDVERRSGSIVLMDAGGAQVAQWEFVRGWPVKWEGPELDASTNEVAIETIEIAHEGLRLIP